MSVAAAVSKLKCEQQYEENSYSCCGDYVIKHMNFDSLIVNIVAQNTASGASSVVNIYNPRYCYQTALLSPHIHITYLVAFPHF